MREVPSVLFGFMRDLVEEAGLDARAALDGLAIGRKRPRFGSRVDWDDLAIFLNRATAGMSDEEMERLGERYPRTNRYVGALLGIVTRPSALYRLGWLASRHAFPHMSFSVDRVSRTNMVLSMRLPTTYEGCYFFFRATVGELRAVPRLVELPDAVVEADVSAHHGHYHLRVTEQERLWAKLRRPDDEHRELLLEDLLSLFTGAVEPGDGATHVVRMLQEQYELTRAEARVAARLADGLSVPDIAEDLKISVETVRTHLKRTYAKVGVRRQVELVRVVLNLSETV